MNKLVELSNWYSNVSKKQRRVLLIVVFVLSAIPFIGWLLIAPWLLPILAYLEYHRE